MAVMKVSAEGNRMNVQELLKDIDTIIEERAVPRPASARRTYNKLSPIRLDEENGHYSVSDGEEIVLKFSLTEANAAIIIPGRWIDAVQAEANDIRRGRK
jgi:hypothetical protein